MVEVYTKLDYSIIPCPGLGAFDYFGNYIPEETRLLVKYIRQMVGDTLMIHMHGDGTLAIPDGNKMYEFAYTIADNPDSIKEEARIKAETVIERNKIASEIGIDCLILCSDYCYNTGPFISPPMFEEFIQPYLYKIINEARKEGLYTIKHTDGNIMPILFQLVDCNPHAIHSLDPMANVDIKLVKELVGHKVCLCGNVDCSLLQTGTDEEVIASAEYCLTHGKPGGGYIFCSSNTAFKGVPPEKYKLMLEVWKRMRAY